jgi:hypothetical protein
VPTPSSDFRAVSVRMIRRPAGDSSPAPLPQFRPVRSSAVSKGRPPRSFPKQGTTRRRLQSSSLTHETNAGPGIFLAPGPAAARRHSLPARASRERRRARGDAPTFPTSARRDRARAGYKLTHWRGLLRQWTRRPRTRAEGRGWCTGAAIILPMASDHDVPARMAFWVG